VVLGKVAVVGAGSWGTVIARIAARTVPTVLWARREEIADEVNTRSRNTRYLPGVVLPEALRGTTSLAVAVAGADLIVMAVPSHGFRAVLEELASALSPGTPVLSLTKGLEQKTHARMTQIVRAVLPGSPAGVLTGPNVAREVAEGHPVATVVAMSDSLAGIDVQQLLRTDSFRVYTNQDVVGCEIAGAAKNVIAIAAGISDGLGLGDSSRAALVTRGLAEIGRLGVALGGDSLTFGGLAGVGDLMVTCTSHLSRNRWVGEQLGQGRALSEILAGMQEVAEGVRTADPLLELAGSCGVEMPIVEQVAAVLAGSKAPGETLSALMTRSAKPEFHEVGT
jgi:glycerol-3-phosphate dehydrogenase (NAD(P)+)